MVSLSQKRTSLVDIATPIIIASLGFFINAMYFGFEYFERTGNVLAQVWAEPIEHSLVVSTIPLYLAIGYLYWREKKTIKELKASNEMKDLFTDILSHDLLNPLNTIQTSIGLLEDCSEDEEIIAIIKKHAWRLEEMINNASKFSQVNAQEKICKVESSLRDYAMIAIEELKPLAEEKRIEIEERFDGSYPVKCDPIFGEVFTNLLSNAIKYSPTDSKVTIGIEDHDAYWKITVKDNGPGIPDEYKEEVFERFTRENKGGTKGSGLGLAIVRKIVELHKGEVWVDDNTPRGCIFNVKIPKEV